MELRGRRAKLGFAAACVGLSVSAGVLASAYTTAGMDPYYLQQRERAESIDTPTTDRTIAYSAPIDLSASGR